MTERNSENAFALINLERLQFKFNFLSPGFTNEIGLFKNQSVSTSLSFDFAAYQEGYTFGLVINNRYRYYYNFTRRLAEGK